MGSYWSILAIEGEVVSLKVYLHPTPSDDLSNGLSQVINAQYKYLSDHDIELVDNINNADIVAAHVVGPEALGALSPRLDVLHNHGLYWTADGGQYSSEHHQLNQSIIQSARRARAITVPSNWVAMAFKRDMRISPTVIGHGIDFNEWKPKSGGFSDTILWNKNRPSDVCDPGPAFELATRGHRVVSTFAPQGKDHEDFEVTGLLSFNEMKQLIRNADIYLATTQETFGIGTLEAMACGVPILGYNWAGTADIVEHKVTGYLVEPGDIDGLAKGVEWIRENRDVLSESCLAVATRYDWRNVIQKYSQLYYDVFNAKNDEPPPGVSVVITNYNYQDYIAESIKSVLNQTIPVELIVVDDGSTDGSREIIDKMDWDAQTKTLYQDNQGVAAARNNGIAAATNEYIICLDADDYLAPTYCEVLLDAMIQDRSLGIAFTGMNATNIDPSNGLAESMVPIHWPEFSWESQSTVHNPPSTTVPTAAMFRKEMWRMAGGYVQSYAPAEDTEFYTRGLSIGFNARKVTDDQLLFYRRHKGSASTSRPYKTIDIWHPWMRDKQYPMASPSITMPLVRSYSDPVVSVIIPVGPGHAQYLPAALDSLLGQTMRNWECIVVNDSGEDIDNVLTSYPFVRLANHLPQGMIDLGVERIVKGPGACRNIGLQWSNAPTVLFLDADDYLMPEALGKMLAKFYQSDGKYVYTDWLSLHPDGEMVEYTTPEYSQKEWMQKGQHAMTVLMSTSWAKDLLFDESNDGWEDWDFFIRAALKGYCGIRLNDILFGYRMYSGARREDSLKDKPELLKKFRDRYIQEIPNMSGCCGGHGPALQKVLAEINQANGIEPLSFEIDKTNGKVKMEYIGSNAGSISWTRDNGIYTGGNNDADRFASVHPSDVEFLSLTGKWKVV